MLRRWRVLLLASVLATTLAPAALAGSGQPSATAPTTSPSAPNAGQVTAFFRAVAFDDADTVGRMVGAVVNANQPNPLGGEPPLVVAVRERSSRVLARLLAHPGTDLEQRAVNGNTALMLAAYLGDADSVRRLLEHGARVNQAGWSALHYASASGDEAIVRELIARGAHIDAAAPLGVGGYTPLMMAARDGKTRVVRLLLDSGADGALVDSEGLTAGQLAERAGHTTIARLLSQKK